VGVLVHLPAELSAKLDALLSERKAQRRIGTLAKRITHEEEMEARRISKKKGVDAANKYLQSLQEARPASVHRASTNKADLVVELVAVGLQSMRKAQA